MHKNLLAYIRERATSPLTSDEEALIVAAFQPKKLRKKQYFLEEGNVCKYVGFIVKGAMRQYSVDDKGAEHIVQLYIENYWASDRESAVTLTPSSYNIDAWENTELLVARVTDMLDLIEKVPSFGQMTRLMDQRSFIVSQRRLNSTISNTAEKRYEEFADNHPQFIQRFPQHLIASFLGITKETLSRIRKQASK
ncbi:cAMP-binding domain of CRP or a regulatory subunit of cAMP-dependent protein kinases [Mucilaginibacter sp. OK268]|uniref:Crp/Fnr family transcriptional regulator n=1 Tax=Mucilaginibacter sp. OK268 TaxID=1881048 RepID=UPI00088E0FCB|nr:Crp/Fnr family transcriptional regulator [Mucilaginibacter sp. OK268]SDQ01494.1 cAMP-binding domain of CRP or a regulatory subunit of cAMP-dependent protein kinases [Mucilaginibacter sp. OK268]